MKLSRWWKMVGILFPVIFFAGCSNKEQDVSVFVEAEDIVMNFSLVPVQFDNVLLTEKLDCKYVQTKEQAVSFNSTGKYVDKVYVKEGQKVNKGDLLCELNSQSLQERIEDLEYSINLNELKLSYLDTNEALDIQDVWIPVAVYGTNDEDAIKERVQSIKDNYARQRVLINDSLEFDKEEYSKLKAELTASRLYADFDGKVYKLDSDLEGSTTKSGKVIMTIVDNNDCIFEVDDFTLAGNVSEDMTLNMKIMYSKAAGEYVVKPYKILEWTDSMKFEVLSGPDNAEIEVGTTGVITLLLDSRENVLTLPKTAVHSAGDKNYVYILNSDGLRDIKYVETGLIGDTLVEIKSGLSDGEKIIKR